jgi:isopenicillin N synthase-like dioxygenase
LIEQVASGAMPVCAVVRMPCRSASMFSFLDTPRVPVIDVSLFDAGDPWRGHVAAQVDWAASAFGLFQVVRHGVDAELMQILLDFGHRFVASGRELRVSERGSVWEDCRSGRTSARQLEGMPDLPGVRDAAYEYMTAMTGLSHKLTAAIARGMGLSDSYFVDRYTGEPRTLLRIAKASANPPVAGSDTPSGAGALPGTFLMLLKQSEGMGVRAQLGSRWLDIPESPGALLCVLGPSVLQLTDERYRAATIDAGHSATPQERGVRIAFEVRVDSQPERSTLTESILDHAIGTDLHWPS